MKIFYVLHHFENNIKKLIKKLFKIKNIVQFSFIIRIKFVKNIYVYFLN